MWLQNGCIYLRTLCLMNVSSRFLHHCRPLCIHHIHHLMSRLTNLKMLHMQPCYYLTMAQVLVAVCVSNYWMKVPQSWTLIVLMSTRVPCTAMHGLHQLLPHRTLGRPTMVSRPRRPLLAHPRHRQELLLGHLRRPFPMRALGRLCPGRPLHQLARRPLQMRILGLQHNLQ